MAQLLAAAAFVLITSIIFAAALPIYRGEHNYSTYYAGDSPIILLSQHGGSIEPGTIPNRLDGCWTGTECVWSHACNETYPRDPSNCPATTAKDSYTKDLALCMEQTLHSMPLSPNYATTYTKPHLIVNELHRIKLDPNREIGEAAQNNSIAEQTYNEIHYVFMEQAKQSSVIQSDCKWGFVIDVHGQKQNEFVNLGYDITTANLQNDDTVLNNYDYRTSMKHVVQTVTNCSKADSDYICPNNFTLSDIIRGSNSLGSILNSTWSANGLQRAYQAVPSELQKFIDDGTFYSGGTSSADLHGSRFGGKVDFVQLEIPRHVRFNQTLRDMFCHDFSVALVQFVRYWYDVDGCFQTPSVSPTLSPTEAPSSNPTLSPSVSLTDAPTVALSDAPVMSPTDFTIINESLSTTVDQLSSTEMTLSPTNEPRDGDGVDRSCMPKLVVCVVLTVVFLS